MLIGISACRVQTIPAAASSSSCCGLCFRCETGAKKPERTLAAEGGRVAHTDFLCSLRRLQRRDNETSLANLHGCGADRGCCDCSVDDNAIGICNPGCEDLSGFR